MNNPIGTLLQADDGSLWRAAGQSGTGEQLYALDGTDLETCRDWCKAKHSELVALVGDLTVVQARTEAAL